jgi:hypothetical protein
VVSQQKIRTKAMGTTGSRLACELEQMELNGRGELPREEEFESERQLVKIEADVEQSGEGVSCGQQVTTGQTSA